ncbi:hypothetical protein J7M22_18220 [Candidatus Poribacteria bacterium]|nr:hypothetical protein [Candidatus Poribacteria bacterium]
MMMRAHIHDIAVKLIRKVSPRAKIPLTIALLFLLTSSALSSELRISVLTESGEPAAGALVQIFPGTPSPDDDTEPIKPSKPRSDGVVGFETSQDGSLKLDLPSGTYTVFAFSNRDVHRFALLDRVQLNGVSTDLTLSAAKATEVIVEALTESGSPADASEIFFRPCRRARGNVGFVGNDGKLRCLVSPGTYNVVLASSFHYLYLVRPAVEVKGRRMILRFAPSPQTTAKVRFDIPPGSFPAIYEVLETDHTYEIVQAIEKTVGYDAAYTKVYSLITPQIPVILSAGQNYTISLSYVVTRNGESYAYEIRPPGKVLTPGEYRMGNTGKEPFELKAETGRESYRPGDQVTLTFRITDTRGNRMTRAFDFSSARLIFPYAIVRDPEGRVIADNRYEIVSDPIPDRFFHFTFSLSKTAIAGRYTVETSMEGGIYGELKDIAHFDVTIPRAQIQIESVQIPARVEVGSSFNVVVRTSSVSPTSATLSFRLGEISLSFDPDLMGGEKIIWKPSLPQIGRWSWRMKLTGNDGSSTVREGEIDVGDTSPPRLILQSPSPAEWGMPVEVRVRVDENDSLDSAWLEIDRGESASGAERLTLYALRLTPYLLFCISPSEAHPLLFLKAFARDRSGNVGSSDRVQINFQDTTPPRISDLRVFEADGKVRFEALASDNRGISEVNLLVKGRGPVRMTGVDGLFSAELALSGSVRYAVEARDLPGDSGSTRSTRFPPSGYLIYTPKSPAAVRIHPSSPQPLVIRAGERISFEAEVMDEEGARLDVPVRWFSSNGVGMMLGRGELVATKCVEPKGREGWIGAVTMRPGADGRPVVGKIMVKVIPADPYRISVIPKHIRASSGDRMPMLILILDRFGNEVEFDPSELTISLDPPDLGRVEGNLFVADRTGRGEIKLKYEKLSASVPVEVYPGEVLKMEIDPPEATLRVGERVGFHVRGFDGAGNEIEKLHPVWLVQGGVGEVDGEGRFRAKRPGKGKVVALLGDISASATIEVKSGELERLTLEPYVEYLPLSRPDRIRRKLFLLFGWDSEWNPVPYGDVRWQTDPLAGKIDGSGLFTATDQTGGAAVGNVVINGSVFAFSGGHFAKSVVVIQLNPPGPISRLQISPEGFPSKPDPLLLTVGERVDLEVTGFDARGNRMSVLPSWQVMGGVGYITGECTFVASRPGRGRVTASALGCSDSISIEVTPGDLARISVLPRYVELHPGESIRFTARGYDSFGDIIPLGSLRWSVPDGLFMASRPGYHSVEAESDGVKGYAMVYVRAVGSSPRKLEIRPSGPLKLRAGETISLEADGYDAGGNRMSIIPGWRVEGNVGRISPDGTFLAIRAGKGRIVAYQDGLEDEVEIEVTPGDPVELCISPPFVRAREGDVIHFAAYALDEMGNETRINPTWRCAGELGEISDDGVLKMREGSSGGYVTAQFQGLSTVAIVEIRSEREILPPASCFLFPDHTSIPTRMFQRFLEIGLEGDELFPIRSVSPTGVVRPETPGNFTVESALGGVRAQAELLTLDEINLLEPSSSLCYGLSGRRMDVAKVLRVEGDGLGYLLAEDSNGWRAVAGYTVEAGAGKEFWDEPALAGETEGSDLPVRMEITPRYVFVRPGEGRSLKFNVHLLDQSGDLIPGRPDLIWRLIGDIGEMDGTGTLRLKTDLKAPDMGEVVVIAPKLNLSARARVIVEGEGTISSIRVEPGSYEAVRGERVRFRAIGTDSAGRMIPIEVSWELLDESGGKAGEMSQDGTVSTDSLPLGRTFRVRAIAEGTWGEAFLKVIAGPPNRIEIRPSHLTVKVRESAKLTAYGYDAFGNSTELRSLRWEGSGGISVEGSDGNGVRIRGERPGSAFLTARSNGIYGYAEIEVESPQGELDLFWPGNPELGSSSSPVHVRAGDLLTLALSPPGPAKLRLEGGEGMVSPDGRVSITRTGSYKVVAERDGISDELNLIVLPGDLARISISPESVSLKPGETIRFSAEGFDRFGNPIQGITVRWEVAGRGEIDETGLFRASRSEGISMVTAETDGILGMATVSVASEIGEPVKLSFKVEPREIPAGGRADVRLTGIDRNGNVVTKGLEKADLRVEPNVGKLERVSENLWSYTAPQGLDVNEISFVAEMGELKDEMKVKLVPANLSEIKLEPLSIDLEAGSSVEIIAKGFDAFGNPISLSPTWSLIEGLGRIAGEGEKIRYTARKAGSERIRASQSGISGEAVLRISPSEPVELRLEPASVRIHAGENLHIKALSSDRFDNSIGTIRISWELKGVGELKPSEMGADFIARRSGRAEITARYKDLKATSTIEVMPGALKEIRFYLSGERITRLEAESGRSYTVLISGADEMGNEIKLESPRCEVRGDVGEMSQEGDLISFLATFIGSGKIWASSGGVSAEIPVKVEPERITIGREGGRIKCAEMELILPPGAIDGGTEIRFSIVPPFGFSRNERVYSRVYRIEPEGMILHRPASLMIRPNRPVETETVVPAFWDDFSERWVKLAGRCIGDGVEIAVNHLGTFALVSGREFRIRGDLRVEDVKIWPNPFYAPDVNRMSIGYTLITPDGGPAEVTMRLIGMNGVVATIVKEVARYPGRNLEMWDCRDKDGDLVHNGRYFLIITASHSGRSFSVRRVVVVFK